MPKFALDEYKHLVGPILLVLSFLFALVGATPGGFANLDPNQEGGSSVGRVWLGALTGEAAGNHVATTVEQGERISMAYPDSRAVSHCTLGYIDRETNIGYTSAHCVSGADEGKYTPGGVEVVNRKNTVIGRAYPSSLYLNGHETKHDVAVIRFSDNVTGTSNTHSGDGVVAISDMRPGDTLCRFGATTRRLLCSEAAEHYFDPSTVVGYTSTADTHGDSGAGVFIRSADGESRGVVGIHAGTTFHNDRRVSVAPMLHGHDAAFE